MLSISGGTLSIAVYNESESAGDASVHGACRRPFMTGHSGPDDSP